MKKEIIIVGGFLDSGKSTYISEERSEEDAVIVFEEGDVKNDGEIFTEELDVSFLKNLPSSIKRIFIELNGTKSCEELFKLFESSELSGEFRVSDTVFVIEPKNYFSVRDYFPIIYGRELYYFENILIRDEDGSDRVYKDLIKRGVRSNIRVWSDDDSNAGTLKESIYMILALSFVVFSGVYLIIPTSTALYRTLSSIVTNFTAILLEAIPFFLLGTFIASVIRHLSIKNRWLKESDSSFVNFFKGIATGLFMPVCDCAGVPVSLGFLNGGAGDVFSLTFALSSPVLNPVVIISTYAAFGDLKIVGLRLLGAFIAIAIAVTVWRLSGLRLSRPKREQMFCNCDITIGKETAILNRIRSVALLTAEEFMNTIGILALGIFMSSVIKAVVPDVWLNGGMGLVTAIAAAYLFSLCSSSDAFVSRAIFTSLKPALGFMIAGPVMDLKNSLVFARSQGKKKAAALVLMLMLGTFISVSVLSLTGIGGL